MQKIYVYIIVLLFLLGLAQSVEASSLNAYFVWEKTVIDVPLNAPLTNYTDLYIVKFYVDGIESNDYKIEKETNCTTFTTVQTNKVGDYHVNYRAYSKKYYIYDEVQITFHVYDDVKPVITGPKEVTLEYLERVDVDSLFYVTDNSDETLSLSLVDTNVSYQTIGEYPAQVVCCDKSGNQAIYDIKIYIVDTTPPVVSINKNLVFSYGNDIDILEFVDIYDSYDGETDDYQIEIDDGSLGKTTVTIIAIDFSGNKICQSFDAFIVDDTSPSIALAKDIVDLDIRDYNSFDEFNYLDYLVYYEDDYDDIDDLYVTYEGSIAYEVGDYQVTYLVADLSGNYIEDSTLFRLRENTGPLISANDEYSYSINSEINVESLVSVSDDFDLNAGNNLEVIYNNLNTKKEGTYFVKYRCYNNSGRYSTKEISISIKDNAQENIINKILSTQGILVIAIIVEAIIFTFVIIKTKNKSDNN